MFRMLPASLPQDPTFPSDLEKLGYFLTANDQIRLISNPAQKFQSKIDRSARVNELHREAMNSCIRRMVMGRLHDLGMSKLRLPLGAGVEDPHIPVLVSPNIAAKKHVIVLFTDRENEPGIFSYRTIGDESVNKGSVVDFVKAILDNSCAPPGSAQEAPGLIITNSSQNIWYRGESRAVTNREWQNLPRATAVTEPMAIDEEKNRVPGQRSFQEHVHYVFQHVLSQPRHDQNGSQPAVCHREAQFSLIGVEYSVSAALAYITQNEQWSSWKSRINCVAMLDPQHTLDELQAGKSIDISNEIAEFIGGRTRAYFLSSDHKAGELLTAEQESRTLDLGCNCYASGEQYYYENVLVRCWDNVLRWVLRCAAEPDYEEPKFEFITVAEADEADEVGSA